MKRKMLFGVVVCAAVLLCSCESSKHLYSTYNPNVYYGMSQSEVDKMLSEKYTTANFGDEIQYDISASQDFMNIDSEFAVAPEVTYKFSDGKLEKITQTYTFPEGTPSSIIELYNTYLALALQEDEAVIEQESMEVAENVKWNYFSTASYWKENELIFFISSNTIDGNVKSIDITFSQSRFSH